MAGRGAAEGGLLVSGVLARAARAVGGRVAVALGAERLTFAQLDVASAGLAAELRRQGAGPGVRVAWRGPTDLDAAVLFAALARLGAVFVPLNGRLAAGELESVIDRADPGLVLGAAGGPELSQLIEASRATGIDAPGTPPLEESGVGEDDVHVVFFTSGSTGAPKGVVLSHRASVLRSLPGYAATPAGPTVCMFPLFHMASWSLALGCWQVGDGVVFVPRPDPDQLLEAVERHRARRLYAIPAVWSRTLDLLESAPRQFDLSSLREADTGTSATPPELLHRIAARLPGTITRVVYGSTEAGPAALLGPDDLDRKPGSVGLPPAAVDLRLTDAGEVCVRSPFLMQGYFRDEEATAGALIDGWYHSGDAGAFDDEGYLSIVGRIRDVIRTGGETVAPVEVEAALASHPGVSEVAVVGVPDPEWGEVICAVVVPVSGTAAAPALTELQDHCRARLAGFKLPRRLKVVDALPRTAATGQIQRSLLIEELGLSDAGSLEPRPGG